MNKAPRMTAALRKEKLAGVSAKRESETSIRRDDAIDLSRDNAMSTNREGGKDARRDIEESIAPPAGAPPAKTLPKVTLYAHQDVLKAIRRLAVDDGVQAQEILRRAVRDYLATRGHHFTDLTTGR